MILVVILEGVSGGTSSGISGCVIVVLADVL